jgi:hypothetical protein
VRAEENNKEQIRTSCSRFEISFCKLYIVAMSIRNWSKALVTTCVGVVTGRGFLKLGKRELR